MQFALPMAPRGHGIRAGFASQSIGIVRALRRAPGNATPATRNPSFNHAAITETIARMTSSKEFR